LAQLKRKNRLSSTGCRIPSGDHESSCRPYYKRPYEPSQILPLPLLPPHRPSFPSPPQPDPLHSTDAIPPPPLHRHPTSPPLLDTTEAEAPGISSTPATTHLLPTVTRSPPPPSLLRRIWRCPVRWRTGGITRLQRLGGPVAPTRWPSRAATPSIPPLARWRPHLARGAGSGGRLPCGRREEAGSGCPSPVADTATWWKLRWRRHSGGPASARRGGGPAAEPPSTSPPSSSTSPLRYAFSLSPRYCSPGPSLVDSYPNPLLSHFLQVLELAGNTTTTRMRSTTWWRPDGVHSASEASGSWGGVPDRSGGPLVVGLTCVRFF
jgi:hypothetical protein